MSKIIWTNHAKERLNDRKILNVGKTYILRCDKIPRSTEGDILLNRQI